LTLSSLFAATTGCALDATSSDSETASADGEALRNQPSRELDASTRFYTPPPPLGATKQVLELLRRGKLRDAARITGMVTTPQAVWFTDGSPEEVKARVEQTMKRAARERRVPVLVAYNLPYRDCAQYSAGGATDTAAYQAWIDAFAAGIGRGKAVVILEPDSLGIIPYNTTIYGAEEWCKPTVTDAEGNTVPAPGANPEERYAQLKYGVSSILTQAPSASVHLDGTHSAWLGVGEAAYRLYRAGFEGGVQQVQGFFLNVSNYQLTSELEQFGTWVSMCLAAGTPGVGPDWMRDATTGAPHFDWCPSQYDPATNYSTVNFTPEFAAGVTAGLEGLLGGASPQVHFVLDTSRNGQGAWQPAPETSYPDPQNWCNPPGRGVGLRPTLNTGSDLADAYLWIKIPGESDGSCNRGIVDSTIDPEWGGIVDPAAGQWFPAQALELARLANPAFF
jgi:endoglucanase